MSCYISKEAPKYKNWQFQSLEKGIERTNWLNSILDLENVKPSNDDPDRFNLYSIQNPTYSIHMWHNPNEGNAITFSNFPDRFKGEFVKHIYELCKKLDAKFYMLNSSGNPAEFDFKKYTKEINQDYFLSDEEKVTETEISEHMGLISIPTYEISKVISAFKLTKIEKTNWEKAVKECYNDKYMVRFYNDWTIIIGQTENLVTKFNIDFDSLKSRKENFLNLLAKFSKDFGRLSYNFNSSKYGVFEDYKFEDGQLVSKYIHEDGDEVKEGKTQKVYFSDFKSLCYDKTILKGVKLFK